MSDPADTPAAPAEAKSPVPVRTARIETLTKGVRAKGFTLGKGQIVAGVPLPHAEHLERTSQAKILEVF